MNHRSIALSFLVMAVLSFVGPASAATITRTFYQNGGNACTGALPTFEGALRKRPKAIANEGTTTAFVTCSAVANDNNLAAPSRMFAYFTNRTTAAVDVSCTFVNGDEFYGSSATTKTLTISPGVLTPMFFDPTTPATTFDRDVVSISCGLPPGVELDIFGQVIAEDIGA